MDKLADLLNKINMSQLLVSAVIVVVAVILWRVFRRAYMKFAAKRAEGKNVDGVADSVSAVTYGVIKGVVIVCVALAVLQINGINVTAMVAGLGIASAIVGLAFQDMLRDIIMGIHIVSDGFFEVGDVIQYKDVEGLVVSYNIRTTKIRDVDNGNIMTICNRNITEIKKRSEFLPLNVPLSYDEDFRKVHRVLGEINERVGKIEGVERSEYKGTHDFQDSAIVYRINIYAPPERKWEIMRAARAVLQEGLADAGIKIPYQQLDVHTYDA